MEEREGRKWVTLGVSRFQSTSRTLQGTEKKVPTIRHFNYAKFLLTCQADGLGGEFRTIIATDCTKMFRPVWQLQLYFQERKSQGRDKMLSYPFQFIFMKTQLGRVAGRIRKRKQGHFGHPCTRLLTERRQKDMLMPGNSGNQQ